MPLKILVCNHPAKSSEEEQSHYVAGFVLTNKNNQEK